jgi:hypothetical protein
MKSWFGKDSAARGWYSLNSLSLVWPAVQLNQNNNGRDHNYPHDVKAHEAMQSEDPHPTEAWDTPAQAIQEHFILGNQQWQHHEDVGVEKNIE